MGFAGRKWGKMLMQPFTPFRGVSEDRYDMLDWGDDSQQPEMCKRLKGLPECPDTYEARMRAALEKQRSAANTDNC